MALAQAEFVPDVFYDSAGEELVIVTCAEDPELPSLLLVNDLGCLGAAVDRSSGSLVLAVPATAADSGSALFTAAVEVTVADEGSWSRAGAAGGAAEGAAAAGGVEELVRVCFFKLAGGAIEEGVRLLDADLVKPQELVCFVPDSFRVPVAAQLVEAWRLAEGGGTRGRRGRGAPPQPGRRGRGRGSAGGRQGRGQAPGAPGPATPRTVAGLAQYLEEKFNSIEGRLNSVESQGRAGMQAPGAAPPPGASPPASQGRDLRSGPVAGVGVSGLLGVASSSVDGAAALAQARQLLGVGDGRPSTSGFGDHAGGANVSSRLGPPPGLGAGAGGGLGGLGARPAETVPEGPGGPAAGGAGQDELLARLVAALEARNSGGGVGLGEMFGLPSGSAGSVAEYESGLGSFVGGSSAPRATAGALGLVNMERLIATRRSHPEVIVAANEAAVRESLNALPGDAWSMKAHAEKYVIPQAGTFTTLKRMAAILAAALDEGRARGPMHQHAFLFHAYRVIEGAATSVEHDLSYAWPLLGIPDPGGRPRPGLAPVEAAGLAAYHRDRVALEAAQAAGGKSRGKGKGGEEGEWHDQGAAGGERRARAKAQAAAAAANRGAEKGGGKGAPGGP